MEKISGIIPPNARTSTVDETYSPTARPGAPAAGRANKAVEEVNARFAAPVQDRVSFSATSANDRIKAMPSYKNTAENARVKVAEDMSKRFFDAQGRSEAPVSAEEVVREYEPAPRPTSHMPLPQRELAE